MLRGLRIHGWQFAADIADSFKLAVEETLSRNSCVECPPCPRPLAMSEGIPDGAIVSIDPEASGRRRRTNRSEDGRKVKQRPGMSNKPREMIR